MCNFAGSPPITKRIVALDSLAVFASESIFLIVLLRVHPPIKCRVENLSSCRFVSPSPPSPSSTVGQFPYARSRNRYHPVLLAPDCTSWERYATPSSASRCHALRSSHEYPQLSCLLCRILPMPSRTCLDQLCHRKTDEEVFSIEKATSLR